MFKLKRLRIKEHVYFKTLDLSFINSGEEENGPYITLMIGPNGTGKSQILSIIIEIFNFLSATKLRETATHEFKYIFEIDYFLNGKEIKFHNLSETRKGYIDDREVKISSIPIPTKFIASAINLTDRYPNLTTKSKLYNANYQYLGVRSASNNAFINNHLRTIVDSLSEAITKRRKIENLKYLFDQLELLPKLSLQYKAGARFQQAIYANGKHNQLDLKKNLLNHFTKYIKEQKEKNRKSYRLEKYEKLVKIDSNLTASAKFLSQNFEDFKGVTKSKIQYVSDLDFSSDKSLDNFAGHVKTLKILIDLEILAYDKINLQKTESQFQFIQASSGEYHLLTSLLGIFSKIEDDSIILIDEPEISLHPNWQMKYIDVLTKIFHSNKTSHFLIASHSHFLVSDLKKSTSAILSLTFDKSEGRIKSDLHAYNTFGWAPENILYTIFNVATVRNHYFEMDLRNLLKLLSDKSTEYEQIKKYIDKFEKFEILESDPLNLIIDQAKKYLEHEV